MFAFVNNHKTLQQVVCLLICVCAWRGPVPMVHDHHALTSSELQNQHATAFHEGRQLDEIIGLHWHIAFPRDLTGEECPVQDEVMLDLPVFACASGTMSFESADTRSMQLTLRTCAESFVSDAVVPKNMPQPDATQPSSFLQRLLSEIPLSAVTGVCLV